jgi:serine/threonine protein kinase
MLLLGIENKEKIDRRKKRGTTRACDIWALGCLFFEILTGEFLFYNTDWISFYN